jgi:hypothetical protein
MLNHLLNPFRAPRNRRSFCTQAVIDIPLESRLMLSAVSWDGGAGTSNWFDAENWSNDVLPTAVDDVAINTGSAVEFGGGTATVASLETTSLTVSAGHGQRAL